MQRTVFLLYGAGCYLLFLITYAALAAFVGDFLLPKTIDTGSTTPLGIAVVVDLALVLLFGLQHSIMARPWFKAHWTRIVPQPIERSTYLLASCVALGILMALWQPIDIVIWNVQHPAGWGLLMGFFAAGWLGVPLVSLAINHFDLFGLRQVWLHFRDKAYESLPFGIPLPYNVVRHPLYIAWAFAFWATPTMTVGHALFAGSLSVYMVVASWIEERDLVAHFGQQYEDYRQRVPAFVPVIGVPAVAAPRSQAELAEEKA